MKKMKDAKRKPRTHFEQIPLKVVRKIAAGAALKEPVLPDNMVVEPASRKTEPYNHIDFQPDSRLLLPDDQAPGAPSSNRPTG
jgi:hypothetical protein